MSKSNNAGMRFLEVLALIFIVLKLCGVITWSWWWVLSPIFIDIALALILLLILGITNGSRKL